MSDQQTPEPSKQNQDEAASKEASPKIDRALARKINKEKQPENDPLHGVRLDRIVTELTQFFTWEQLASKISLNCFKSNQSVKSTLKFLRKTPWARQKVETLWVWTFVDKHYVPPTSERSKAFLEKQKNSDSPRSDGKKSFNPWTDKK